MWKSIKNVYASILLFISTVLLIGIIFTAVQLIHIGDEAKMTKNDYAHLHSVQYGLFNSTIWAEKIAHILDTKIDEFDFSTYNRKEIKKYVETILDTLIVEADRTFRDKNEKQRGFFDSILGSTKQMITDSLIDIKALRERVPEFTDAIMNELEKPSSQALLKKLMREKLHQLTKDNLAHTNMEVYDAIIKKYGTSDYLSCDAVLSKKLTETSVKMNQKMLLILLLTLILVIAVIFQSRILNTLSLLLLSLTSVSLLVSGVMLPMLDIEAKIDKLYFTILEKPLTFHNQILFFQTKSISDLVRLLIESGEAKMMVVGVLLTMFSIVFPFLKIISSYMYFYAKSVIGNNPITRFFALRSTKWSMADVMVVSIFMSYLGLDGVVDGELKHLKSRAEPINVITSNGTHLEVGFYLFMGFVATSFVLSILLERSKKKKHN
jgi:hypothetical protein